jgi:branched-chain amino acid transport system substrate-binding protein
MKKGLKRLLLPLLLSAIMIFVSACGASGGDDSNTIKIGAVYSITGPNSPLGVPEKQAVEMLAKQINDNGGINGKKIELIIEDDKSDNTEAVKKIKKLVTSDKVVAVLGSSGSGPSLGMAEYAESRNIPMISMAAANEVTDPVRPGIFKTPHTDIHATKLIYKFLQQKGLKKVAFIYDSNPYGSSWATQLKKFASQYGIQIVAEEKYGTKDQSMSSQLTKLKNSDAEVIIIAGTNPGPATIVKEAKQLGIKIPIVSSHGSANHKFLELAGKDAEGIYMAAGKLLEPSQIKAGDPQEQIIKKFVADYQAAYKNAPDGFAGYAYDGLNILVEALKSLNGDGSDSAKLAQAIENVKYVGVTGEFKFSAQDHNGLSEESMIMMQVKDGKFQLAE